MEAVQPLAHLNPPLPQASATYGGRFVRSPYSGTLYEAELSMLPLHKPSEFRHVQDFEREAEAPILFSPSQRYRFLAELVDGMSRAVPELQLTLVRLGAPDYRTQLPARLLEPDILLSHDPWLFLPSLALNPDTYTMIVWQTIRTDSVEPGDNSLLLSLFGSSGVEGFLRHAQRAPILASLHQPHANRLPG